MLGARLVAAWGGTRNVAGARSALQRIEAVLPPDLRDRLDAIQMFSPAFQMCPEHRDRLDLLHEACTTRTMVRLLYAREDGQPSTRTVRPLALYFWGGVWTLVAWCDLRGDFRSFRIDRIAGSEVLPESFTQRPGEQLADFLRSVVPARAAPIASPGLPAEARVPPSSGATIRTGAGR